MNQGYFTHTCILCRSLSIWIYRHFATVPNVDFALVCHNFSLFDTHWDCPNNWQIIQQLYSLHITQTLCRYNLYNNYLCLNFGAVLCRFKTLIVELTLHSIQKILYTLKQLKLDTLHLCCLSVKTRIFCSNI